MPGISLTTERRTEIRAAVNNQCQLCGKPEEKLRDGRSSLHIHRKIRPRDGGGDEDGNLEVRCPKCHAAAHIARSLERNWHRRKRRLLDAAQPTGRAGRPPKRPGGEEQP